MKDTTTHGVGLHSLAVTVPARTRSNDELRARHPDLYARAEEGTLSRVMNDDDARAETSIFDAAMKPYLRDPFRGVKERRVLGPEETSIDMEVRAGQAALELAGLDPKNVDQLISVGFLPHHVGIGNAVYVAKALGLEGGAFNLETACAGPLNALRVATAMVHSGVCERVLVTVSCAYSKYAREDDTLSWFLGDGGGAFVVGHVPRGEGYLAAHSIHTADTCDTWYYQLELDDNGAPARVMRAHPQTGRVLRRTVEHHLRTCCEGAAERAGMRLDDVDFFVFHTPTAWFADFAAKALGIDPERTTSVYERFANVGPALTPINLHHAAHSRRLRPGQTVMVYGPGSVSSAAAVLMRWGDVPLSASPEEMQ